MSATPPVLRPMGVGDILDRAISTYRQNFLTLLGIVAVVNVPLLLIEVVAGVFALSTNPFAPGSPDITSNPYGLLVYSLTTVLTTIVRAIVYAFEASALAYVISEFFLGRKIGFLRAYGSTLGRGLHLLVAIVIQGLVVIVLYGIAFVPFIGLVLMGTVFARQSSSSALSGILAIVLAISCLAFIPALILVYFLTTRWAFTYQAIVIEKLGALSGLRRSWNLVRGSFWRVFGIIFLLGILVAVIILGPTYAMSFGLIALSPLSNLASIAPTIVTNIMTMIVLPLQIGVLTILYYDLRIRKEGFDLEMMAKQLEVPATAPLPEPNT